MSKAGANVPWEEGFERFLAYAIAGTSGLLFFLPEFNKGLAVLGVITAPTIFLSLSRGMEKERMVRGIFQVIRYGFVAWLTVVTVQQATLIEFPEVASTQVVEVLTDLLHKRDNGYPDTAKVEEIDRSPYFLGSSSYIVRAWKGSSALAAPFEDVARSAAERAAETANRYLQVMGFVLLTFAVVFRGLGYLIGVLRPN